MSQNDKKLIRDQIYKQDQQTKNDSPNKKIQNDQNNPQDNRENVLKEIMNCFFNENWKDHNQHIREEVDYHFNIGKLLNDINQSTNKEKKLLQQENLKKDVFCFVPFTIITNTLLICTQFLREVLKKKYIDSLKKDYPALHDPQDITCQILNEFFEQINLIGFKNVKAFVKSKLTRDLQDISLKEPIKMEKVFEFLDDYFLNELLKSNSGLKKPADHKKRSSMTLFRTNSRRRSLDQRSMTYPFNQTDSDNFYSENIPPFSLHHLITSKENKLVKQSPDLENSAIFAHQQPTIVPHSKLDIMYLFLGDINENKIITDNEFIEKHIEIADCKCREQRYLPSLQRIPEAEDDGYESDKSEQHPHSSNSNYSFSEDSSSESNNSHRLLEKSNQNILRSQLQKKQIQDHQKKVEIPEKSDMFDLSKKIEQKENIDFRPKNKKNENQLINRNQKQSSEQESSDKSKHKKSSDGIVKNVGKNIEDYFQMKDRFQDYDDEEEDDEEDDDIGYTQNDQFLLQLKGTKKTANKKGNNLLDQSKKLNKKKEAQLNYDNKTFNSNDSNEDDNDKILFPSIKNKRDDYQKRKKDKNLSKSGYDISHNYFSKENMDDGENDGEIKSLQQLNVSLHRFLSQEDGDDEDYNSPIKSFKKNGNQNHKKNSHTFNNEIKSFNEYSNEQSTNNQQLFIQNSFPHVERRNSFETQVNAQSENEGSMILDEEEIFENRQRLTHFLQSLCYEALEILESVNFQTYVYYEFKNRFRFESKDQDENKNMTFLNMVDLINKIIDEHFLSEYAQQNCEKIYQQCQNDAEHFINTQNSCPTKQQIQNITTIYEEVEQSIIINEAFEELTMFFMTS